MSWLEAGSGNRTRMISLEGWSFTTKLYPRCTIKLTQDMALGKHNFAFYSIF